MKNIAFIVLSAVLIVSCGTKEQTIEEIIATNDAVVIQTKRDVLVNEQLALTNQLKQLDEKLKTINPDRNIPLITAFTSTSEEFKHYLELQGSVNTKQNLVLTPETSGLLNRVFVKEGDKVTKGQLLATIDDGGLAQQKTQFQIRADLAKTTYERQKRLWEQQIGSEIQYLQAKSAYEAEQKGISQLEQQLAKSNVRAPFSGIIDDVFTEEGSFVSAGQTQLLRIVNLNEMYIETDVPESYLTTVTKGKDVEVLIAVLGKTVTAKVRQTGNYINPANRTFKVEIAVPNKDKNIKPNLTARLKINDYTNTAAILIPQSIISENAEGQQYIYVLEAINNGKATAKQRIIETGKTQGNYIEIISGLKTDVEIINEGSRSVKDGQTVKIINQEL